MITIYKAACKTKLKGGKMDGTDKAGYYYTSAQSRRKID